MCEVYEELAKRLREQVECDKKKYPQGATLETLLLDLAADAIEELLQKAQQFAPVQPHGRLIDADAFAADMKKRQEAAGKWLREAKDRETAVRADAVLSFLCEVKLTLDSAPTIIPPEEDDT